MTVSVFELFTVGIGPSSSHTVGPMRAASAFVSRLTAEGLIGRTARVRCELFGSLGATGHGHGSVEAVMAGLEGEQPQLVDPRRVKTRAAEIRSAGELNLAGTHPIPFAVDDDIVLNRRERLEFHSNGMVFEAWDGHGERLERHEYYSVGGGFVVDGDQAGATASITAPVPYPFSSGADMLRLTAQTGLRISDLMMANERVWRSESEIRAGLLHIWNVMQECVERGTHTSGILPGGLEVPRRAAELRDRLAAGGDEHDALRAMEWVTVCALAVNEENAAGGRVVTAPTNGAAGIIPAVLHYYRQFVDTYCEDGVVRFLLTAGAIGLLFKENASISGAEVGCQGEVGSACSMAAAALAEVLGASPGQVENAAEIGIEHNLGLTCDPIAGLVQIPCIERNAVASIQAISAARMAMHGDGTHVVSLDKAITTMRRTGADMSAKYKETARGGLALDAIELPLSAVEC